MRELTAQAPRVAVQAPGDRVNPAGKGPIKVIGSGVELLLRRVCVNATTEPGRKSACPSCGLTGGLLSKVTGGKLVTATLSLAVAVAVPSLTWSVKIALVAPVAATISAVIVPLELAMFEIVTPFAGLVVVTVTVRLPLAVSASVTVAIVELLPLAPAIRVNPLAALIVGA